MHLLVLRMGAFPEPIWFLIQPGTSSAPLKAAVTHRNAQETSRVSLGAVLFSESIKGVASGSTYPNCMGSPWGN